MSGPSQPDEQPEQLLKPQQRFRLPRDAREIVVVRHGSSEGDSGNVVTVNRLEHADPALLPRGHAQAAAVAERLQAEPVSAIFASSLRRTQDTAAPLAEALQLPVRVSPYLHEVHLGDWEHSFHAKAAEGASLIKRMFAEETWEVFPNSEPLASLSARVTTGMQEVIEAIEPGQRAVVFTHGGIIGEILRQTTSSRQLAFASSENGSISRLIVNGDSSWALRCYNDIAHLIGL